MKRLLFLTILTIIFSSKIKSQNYIYYGDNRYEATPSWSFPMNSNMVAFFVELTVAKRTNGSGYLMISIGLPYKSDQIAGTVKVFLNDGSIIKCTDRGIRDHVDGQSISLYNLTTKEIEQLKYSIISKIRFSIKDNFGYNSYTADNKKISFDTNGYYETDNDIIYLFK